MSRIAIVKKDKCNPLKCQNLCVKLCPINRTGENCIVIENNKAKIDEALCTGCGICQNRCPFDAIHIVNLPEKLTSKPIHRYGENGFVLYNLPVPIFGKVVGIIGKNGIGKSTALNILAGLLPPNFGDVDDEVKEFDYDKLIEYFKGTEAQVFFEKMKNKDIKVSYKPQNVELIPKQFNGTVRELLERTHKKGDFGKVVEALELENVLDKNINEISGGELQRTAIAATVMKDANVYIFDEPSSFLDIKQRIKASNFIKSLSNEENAILVVEHDLIIFDYITDLVHIMYGKENSYGIVSMPKSSKQGINTYLSGFLKEENIRFRENEIKFESTPLPVSKDNVVEIEWKDVVVKLGSFELEAKNGMIKQQEVTGVVGENGMGKTTFAKVLAGVMKQNKGVITKNSVISYKPQYIEPNDELVVNALKGAEKYETLLIRPLDLKPLYFKKLNELSGGQLQRVAIASCLSKDADIFLLDEPSAYLDVEQRLIVAKTIKDFIEQTQKSALIIDHDLLFIDYLSNKLLIFSGEASKKGIALGPFDMEEGMNRFLSSIDITLRRDFESKRPRVNKKDSQMDRNQKQKGNYYYN